MTTSLKSLLAAATPLREPIHHTNLHEYIEYEPANAPLTAMILNAAPLVLEYMKGAKHGRWCGMYKPGMPPECTCGYSALARALGVDGES